MRAFLEELKLRAITPVTLFISSAGTVLLTLSGPFGTYAQLPYAVRAVFWLVIILLALVISLVLRIILENRSARYSVTTLNLIVGAMMTVVFTPVVMAILWVFDRLHGMETPSVLELTAYVGTISFFVAIARMLAHLQQQEMPRLLGRLPESRWGALIRMSSKDHYVEVVTDKGSEQILMRFADALAELDGVDGARVHRSHWVARDAVATSERENGRVFLVLVDGSRIPVSRGYMDAAREAGLVEAQTAA